MASQLIGLILRLVKGSPLTDAEGDNNLVLIRDFVNGQANVTAASLNPDGTLKAGAINAISQFSTLSLFADTFALNESLPTSSFSGGNYTVTNANITALAVGSRVAWKADLVNTGGDTVTFTNGTTSLAAVPIVKGATTPIIAGDIISGQVVEGIFDGIRLHLMQQANVFASAADIQAGTDTTKVVTSAALKSASLTYVTPTPVPMTFAAGSIINTAHGLLVAPSKVRFVLVCTTAENGFVIGDEVNYQDFWVAAGGGYPSFVAGANATSVFITYNGLALAILNKVTGVTAGSFVDNANWSVKCYASV